MRKSSAYMCIALSGRIRMRDFSMRKFYSNTVSKEGLIGARLGGIIVTSWLLPLCIGYAFINPVAIILFGISITCLLFGRKYIKKFFGTTKLNIQF